MGILAHDGQPFEISGKGPFLLAMWEFDEIAGEWRRQTWLKYARLVCGSNPPAKLEWTLTFDGKILGKLKTPVETSTKSEHDLKSHFWTQLNVEENQTLRRSRKSGSDFQVAFTHGKDFKDSLRWKPLPLKEISQKKKDQAIQFILSKIRFVSWKAGRLHALIDRSIIQSSLAKAYRTKSGSILYAIDVKVDDRNPHDPDQIELHTGYPYYDEPFDFDDPPQYDGKYWAISTRGGALKLLRLPAGTELVDAGDYSKVGQSLLMFMNGDLFYLVSETGEITELDSPGFVHRH
jgi:hypothetical protein